ncbi:uncharacterized protein Bfra_006112 [Botrytis fragariae]|uniref:Uncharacterized protein n=1 Tax=Botrytis fragariae TaxID=1964551 RepID=A0A8H6ASN0_9HELO|nr:uncharacterized protein Bfra_006112 [Botrytis fragariae]KAF5872749.1 hypothetical protein Bfra_006112 [Botrytis fragariae]
MVEHNNLKNFSIGVLDDLFYLHIAKDSHVKINFADLPKLSDDSRVCVKACAALHSLYRHYREDFLSDGSNVTAFGLFIRSLLPTLNPPRALGLILLLDQAPRQLLRGAGIYYAFTFFDRLALQVVTYIHSLPPNLRPDLKEQWMDKLNYSFNHWVYIRSLFILPFVHSESLQQSAVAKILCTELRVAIEKHTGLKDSYLVRGIAELDGTAFSHLSLEGPVKNGNGNVNMASYAFWFLALLDAHAPVLIRFNRFPWRNRALGRRDTEEEKIFLQQTNWFGCISVVNAATIKERLENGLDVPLLDRYSDS